MSNTFIPIPSMRDVESQRLDALMTGVAHDMAAVDGVSTFAATGWLPDRFFALLGEFYDAYDSYITHNIAASELKIQCKLGCSRCCRQTVHGVYSFEIVSLYRQLRPSPEYGRIHDTFLKHANEFQGFIDRFRQNPANAAASEQDTLTFAMRSYAGANLWCPLLVANAPQRVCDASGAVPHVPQPDRPDPLRHADRAYVQYRATAAGESHPCRTQRPSRFSVFELPRTGAGRIRRDAPVPPPGPRQTASTRQRCHPRSFDAA